jgi:hypothetical protein
LDGDTKLGPLVIVLKSDPEQEQALLQLLDQQQNKAATNYHNWLTPDEFGAAFGVNEADLRKTRDWLTSHGFTVSFVAPGRRSITFSGAVRSVEESFHTEIHGYELNGIHHFSNNADIAIPASLGAVVSGVSLLNDFEPRTFHTEVKRVPVGETSATSPKPEYTGVLGSHYLSPGDFAQIYNTAPLLSQQIDGNGQTIAIIGDSNSVLQGDPVIAAFRSLFLPTYNANNTNVFIVPTSANCPIPGTGDSVEAYLDTEWSGAVAPRATIAYIASGNVVCAADQAVQSNIASVISMSFGLCELNVGSAEYTQISNIWSQAAAEGISVFVSAGDSGSAGCDNSNTEQAAGGSYAVNGLGSTPYNISVGGTEFVDNSGSYWTGNTQLGPFPYTSTTGYIPEEVWNESGAVSGGTGIWAGGGGISQCTAKPSWQTGPGVPSGSDPLILPSLTSVCPAVNGQHRYLPDVSLTAAAHDGYLFCDSTASCFNFVGFTPTVGTVGGTSAAAPSFAGIQALIDQQYGRQGQANYVYYRLAAQSQSTAACGSTTVGGPNPACIFNDIRSGNNGVPCLQGSQDCVTVGTSGGGVNYQLGNFNAGTGYDLATGLGSVNAYNLFQQWNNSISFPTTISTTADIYAIAASSSTTITAAVTGSRTPSPPLGTVAFHLGSSGGQILGISNLTSTSSGVTGVAVLTIQGTQLQVGSNVIYAVYSGDGADDAPAQTTVTVVVTANAAQAPTTTALSSTAAMATQGASISLTATVQSAAGTATGTVSFYDEGQLLTSVLLNNSGVAIYTSTSLPAGIDSITAKYGGDENFLGSTSSPVSITVTGASPQLTVSPSSGVLGVTAFIKTDTGFTPNGLIVHTATFPDGSLSILDTYANASGGYQYTRTYSTEIGTYRQIDTDEASGRSTAPASWTVSATVANDFSLQISPSSQSVGQGSSVKYNVVTATTSGSGQSVALSASNVPSGLTASFSPATVTSGNQSTLTVSATSSVPTGTYTLTVTGTGTSATQTYQISVGVTQAGTGPLLTLSPSILPFNPQAVGSVSAPETVSLMNNGSGQLKISSIALLAGSDYALTLSSPAPPNILNPLVPYNIQVAFEPTTTGTRNGEIIVYDNAPGSPHVVSLTGTGTPAPPTTGTINVNATLNGVALPNTYGYQYSLVGPATYTGYDGYSFAVMPGPYAISFTSSPTYLTLSSVTPSATQSVAAGGSISYTLNFTAPDDFYGPTILSQPGGGPSPQVVTDGSTATYLVDVTSTPGSASSPITLSVAGAPPNSTPSFAPQPVYSGGGGTLSVGTTAGSTPPGVYTLTVSGTNVNGVTHTGATSSLAVTTPPAAPVLLVSQSSTGVQGNWASSFSGSSVSGDGRYFVFSSASTNLVASDTSGHSKVLLRDLQSGTTSEVSVSTSGIPADSDSYGGAISANGQYVAFTSSAGNLYPGSVQTHAWCGVYVRDVVHGITEREDVVQDGTAGNADSCGGAAISADGRFVAFVSDDTNLISGTSGMQVYLRDRKTAHMSLISSASDGSTGNAPSSGVAISADGRYVAFTALATNLVPQNTGGLNEAFVRDTQSGVTSLVSISSNGLPANASISLAAGGPTAPARTPHCPPRTAPPPPTPGSCT